MWHGVCVDTASQCRRTSNLYVHNKSVFYCIILKAPKTQSNTGELVFDKIP